MTTSAEANRRLAVLIGVAYILAIALILMRSVQRQRAALRARRKKSWLARLVGLRGKKDLLSLLHRR